MATPTQQSTKARWGLSTTGRVNRHIIAAAKTSPWATIAAVSSRSVDKAKEFASANGIGKWFGSFEEMCASPDIDVIYVSSPNVNHKEQCLVAIRHGKHVLCEKPLALTEEDAAQIYECAAAHSVTVTEGCMNLHGAAQAAVRSLILDGAIGRVVTLRGSFNFPLNNRGGFRVAPASEGGGSMWDVGCYVTQLARYVLDDEPLALSATRMIAPPPQVVDPSAAAADVASSSSSSLCDLSACGWLRFRSGATLSFDCGFQGPQTMSFEILGTKGSVRFEHPFKPPPTGSAIYITKKRVGGTEGSPDEWETETRTVRDSDESGAGHLYQMELDELSFIALQPPAAAAGGSSRRQPLLSPPFSIGGIKVLAALQDSMARGGEVVQLTASSSAAS